MTGLKMDAGTEEALYRIEAEAFFKALAQRGILAIDQAQARDRTAELMASVLSRDFEAVATKAAESVLDRPPTATEAKAAEARPKATQGW